MDKYMNTAGTTEPITPARNSNRHELLWENFPDCTNSHWEEIGLTPVSIARPRNYSKAVSLSDRRRSLSEGRDWTEFDHSYYNEVFVRDKIVPFRHASSQVSEGRLRKDQMANNDTAEREGAYDRENDNGEEKKRSVEPRLLDSDDLSSSNDDVFHGPVFYMDSAACRRSPSNRRTLASTSSNCVSIGAPGGKGGLSRDMNKAAKQLKYYEPSTKGRNPKILAAKGSSLAAKKGAMAKQEQGRCAEMDDHVYEVVGEGKSPSAVDGNSLTIQNTDDNNKAHEEKIDTPGQGMWDPHGVKTSDEDSPDPNDDFVINGDSYEHSTSKNSCSQEVSNPGDMFGWNICFDPTPMKSDTPRMSATEEQKRCLPSTSREGVEQSANVFQPSTSRKRWDKTSKKSDLRKCKDEYLPSLAFSKGRETNLGLYLDDCAGNKTMKFSGKSLRSVHDQDTHRQRETGGSSRSFARTLKPCDVKGIPKVNYCSGCERKKVRDNKSKESKRCGSLRRKCTCSCSCNADDTFSELQSRFKKETSKRGSHKLHSNCRGGGEERCRKYNHWADCETLHCAGSQWSDECCRRENYVNSCCPMTAYLPMLFSHGCCQRMLPGFQCNRQTYASCSERKHRGRSRPGPCTSRDRPRNSNVSTSEDFGPDCDAGQNEYGPEGDAGVDCVDGKTYYVIENSQDRKVGRSNSVNSFMKPAEAPVLVSYRRTADESADVFDTEQKRETSCQTEPATANCSTQAKPAVRHSVTQYSAKVNHCNKDTQCITHTASVCMQAVLFEPQERGTQYPEKKENHHKQTQCNFVTSKKSVQANLKYKPYRSAFNVGAGTNYRRREDFNEDSSFRSSQSSFLMPPDISSNVTIVATKNAPRSAVAAVAAASVSADYQPQMNSNEDLQDKAETRFEPSPVTLRCSVMSARPAENFTRASNFMDEDFEGIGEDCVDEGRLRTVSQRNSIGGHSTVVPYQRSRGKSVSFPSDIARFFEHQSSPQRRVLVSDSSDDS